MAVLSTIANVATPGLPVGSIQAFAGANAPTGWLLCDGSAVGRAEYPELFSTLGTAYGAGNTTTTFNIPDLRGRVPAGKDNMGGTAAGRLTSAVSGVSGTALGSSGGSQNIPDHSHQSYIRVLEFYDDMIVGQSGQSQIGGYNSRTGAWTTWQHPVTTVTASANNYTGRSTQTTWVSQTNMVSDGPSYQQTPQNVQPTLVVNYIIKAVADIARGGWYTQSSPPVVTQLPSNPQFNEQVFYMPTNVSHGDDTGGTTALEQFPQLFLYNGSRWIPTAGKTHLARLSCTNSRGPRIDGIFTSLFRTYTIVWSVSSATGGGFIFSRLRSSGSDNSTGYYWTVPYSTSNNTGSGIDNTTTFGNSSGVPIGYYGGPAMGEFTLIDPALLYKTGFSGIGHDERSGTMSVKSIIGGTHNSTSAFDGIKFFISGQAQTGIIDIYGNL